MFPQMPEKIDHGRLEFLGVIFLRKGNYLGPPRGFLAVVKAVSVERVHHPLNQSRVELELAKALLPEPNECLLNLQLFVIRTSND